MLGTVQWQNKQFLTFEINKHSISFLWKSEGYIHALSSWKDYIIQVQFSEILGEPKAAELGVSGHFYTFINAQWLLCI